MRMQTFFQILCFVLFCMALSRLIRSRNSILNETIYDDMEDTTHLSICIKIDPKQFDCDHLEESDSSQICYKLRDYFNYTLSRQPKSPREILQKYDELQLPALFEFNINVTDLFRYLNAKHICFLYKLNVELPKPPPEPFFLVKVINKFHLTSKYFVHGKSIPRFYGRVEELKCENFISCNYFSITVRQFKNQLLPAPFETDCVTHSKEAYEFRRFEMIDVRSACVMEFVKHHKHRIFSFFYTQADNETIVYSHGRTPIDPKLVQQSKKRCKAECHELLFTFLEIKYDEQDYFGIRISSIKFNNIAKPLLSTTDFWIQFFALISLFFKLSLMSILFRLKRVVDRLGNRTAIAVLTILFWTTLVLSFFLGYYQGASMYRNYVNSTLQNYVYRVAPVEPAEFNAAVCRRVNLENLQNLSVFEIEKQTTDHNLSIWRKFDEEQIEITQTLPPFKMFLKRARRYLEQCFLIEVKIVELRYRSMLAISSLVIKSPNYRSIYLGDYGKRITPVTKLFSRLMNIARFEKVDVVNCRNYRLEKHGCDSQDNCIGEH